MLAGLDGLLYLLIEGGRKALDAHLKKAADDFSQSNIKAGLVFGKQSKTVFLKSCASYNVVLRARLYGNIIEKTPPGRPDVIEVGGSRVSSSLVGEAYPK